MSSFSLEKWLRGECEVQVLFYNNAFHSQGWHKSERKELQRASACDLVCSDYARLSIAVSEANGGFFHLRIQP